MFFFILDAAAYNAFILKKLKSPELKTDEFLKALSVELVLPYMKTRKSNIRMPTRLRLPMREFILKAEGSTNDDDIP
ncbi:hypothetical protein U1Q18_047540 [Sarracenia purpurea var. burkii]